MADATRCVTLTEPQWERLLSPLKPSETYQDYRLGQANRLLAQLQTIPWEWAHSSGWRAQDLFRLQNALETRWKVNFGDSGGLFDIVDVSGGWLDAEIGKSLKRPVRSIRLIAIKNLFSEDDLPKKLDDCRWLEFLEEPMPRGIPQMKAAYRDGLNDEDERPFVFENWAPSAAHAIEHEAGNRRETDPLPGMTPSEICSSICCSLPTLRTYAIAAGVNPPSQGGVPEPYFGDDLLAILSKLANGAKKSEHRENARSAISRLFPQESVGQLEL